MGLRRGGSVPASGHRAPAGESGRGATRGLRANAGDRGRKSGGRGQKSGARRVPGRLRAGIGQVATKIRDGVANRTGMCDGGIAQPASSDALWAEMQSCITKQVNWLSFSHLMVLPFSPDGRTYPCDLLRNGDFPSARRPRPSGDPSPSWRSAVAVRQPADSRTGPTFRPLASPTHTSAPTAHSNPRAPTGTAICPKRKLLSPNTHRPGRTASMAARGNPAALQIPPDSPGSARHQLEGS